MKIPTPTRAQRNYAYTVLGAVALLLVGFGLITGDEVQLYLNLAAALLGITGNVIAKGNSGKNVVVLPADRHAA